MWPDHRNALDGAWPSQAAHLTSQVGKRDKDPSPLSFPKWRGYICLLGPVEWFRGAERKLEVPKASPHYRHPTQTSPSRMIPIFVSFEGKDKQKTPALCLQGPFI